MAERRDQIARFLERAGRDPGGLTAIAGDASFRRYFRLPRHRGQAGAILMDAPPGPEDVRPFIAVAGHLAALGLSSPRILAADIATGFLLLEDFGNGRFTDLLADRSEVDEDVLYGAAVDLLIDLHRHSPPARLEFARGQSVTLPAYGARLLLDEARLFTKYYLPAVSGAPTPAETDRRFEALWRRLFELSACRRPVLVLRDYHADNLMWLPERRGIARVGLLDFQDAVSGHPAYDLLSLLQDARREVSGDLEARMMARYQAGAGALDRGFDAAAFTTAYHLLGAQRHTKVIGIFTRLWRRDGKPGYLGFLTRVWGLLEGNLEHPAMAAARDWFDQYVPPHWRAGALPEGGVQ